MTGRNEPAYAAEAARQVFNSKGDGYSNQALSAVSGVGGWIWLRPLRLA
jgi:hypothetical protein